jgi:hypothetical protein
LYEWILERDNNLKVGMATSYKDSVIGESYLQMELEDFKKLLISTTDSIREKFPGTFKRFFIKGDSHGVSNSSRANGVMFRDWLKYLVDDSEKWIDLLG